MSPGFLATARELVRIAPLVFHEDRFALKGGTAINLFLRDMPRLSVDLDLVLVDGPYAATPRSRTSPQGSPGRVTH